MAELKPCPFCGGEAILRAYEYDYIDPTYDVLCPDCGAQTMEFFTKEEAEQAWNRRVSDGK